MTRGRTGPAFWRARAKPASATVSDDGRFVFEEYREGGVIGLTDGPDTLLMIIRDRGRITREVRVRDIAARPTDLPRTTSHRNWSIMRFFGPANRVMIDLPDGRTLAIDPVSGAVAAQPPRTDGRPGYCRSAGHPNQGPCARR